jgi:hypothetical protein
MSRTLLVFIAAVAVMLGGCSSTSSPEDGPHGPTVDIEDYLPLLDGFSWTYVGDSEYGPYETTAVCNGPNQVAGHTVYTIENDVAEYFFLASDGWFFIDYPYYNTPVRVMPSEVAVGSSCAGQGNFAGLTWTCLSIDESVSVEAGDFEDCLKLKEVGVYGGHVTTEKHFWLAPGVGLVKELSVVGDGIDSGRLFAMGEEGLLEVELSSYSAP